MIDFEDIWQDHQLSELPSMMIFFRCDHCNCRLSEDSLNLAIFLYGFFSLHKRNKSYIGITCPSCMTTILIKENRSPASLFIKLSSTISFGNLVLQTQLIYFISNYHHGLVCQYLQDLKPFKINYFHSGVSEDGLKSINDRIDCYIAENGLDDHLCSFVAAGSPFPPIELLVLWVDEQHIEELIKYEQENNVRIIPRYMFQMNLVDRIEAFCALYGFHSNFDRLIGPAQANLRLVKSQNLEIDQILSENQEAKYFDEDDGGNVLIHKYPELFSSSILNPELIDKYRRAKHPNSDNEFDDTSEFINILAADPCPWDFPSIERDWIKDLWKRPSPFQDQEIPTLLAEYKKSYKNGDSSNQHNNRVAEIKSVFSKGYIQKYISSLFSGFIWDYSQIVNKYAFSYSDVWNLKERYLEKIYRCVRNKKATRPHSQYKEACRRAAKAKWAKNPKITIADMILSNEINEACDKKLYSETALRKWIKDLCPNRKPGRRPKKKAG